jgi:hypothetical protein
VEKLFRKKYFLEIYFLIGIAIGPFIILATGASLFWGLTAGVLIAIVGRIVFLSRQNT